MKKVAIVIFICLNFTTLFANNNIVQKAMECYIDFSNSTFKFKAIEANGGYDIKIVPQNEYYKEIFDTNRSVHIDIDKGPIVTNPHFTIAKAGLSSSGNMLNIFSQKIVQSLKDLVKKEPSYRYEGVVNFNNKLTSKTIIDPIVIADKDAKLESSKLEFTGTLDIDNCIGDGSVKIDTIKIYPTDNSGIIVAKGIDYKTAVTKTPIGGFTIFGENALKVDKLYFMATKNGVKVETNTTINLSSLVEPVDKNHLKIDLNLDTKALDVNTIALARGIKETKFNLELANAKTEGLVEFLKLSKKLEEAQINLQKAQQNSDDIALQKAILELNSLSSVKSVEVYNKIMIKDKTKLKLNLELIGDRTSFVKLDLLYKAKPISGNMEGAIIELAAQNLAIADGTFEVKLDSQLATSINPLATLVLDMLKTKGLVSVQNGIYHLKGELKSGKIVINGKAYTLQELATILF